MSNDHDMVTDEKNPTVEIPFIKGHYQFTFKTCKGGKTIRRIYKGEDMYALMDIAVARVKKEYPKSINYLMHSPQCD